MGLLGVALAPGFQDYDQALGRFVLQKSKGLGLVLFMKVLS